MSLAFIKDIQPFLYGKPVTYVDVGAYKGEVFAELCAARRIRLHEAHLIEPNPSSFEKLQLTVASTEGANTVRTYNVAIGAEPGVVKMVAANTMTRIVRDAGDEAAAAAAEGEMLFEAERMTLADVARNVLDQHISLLKLDAEGSELDIILGAEPLLSAQSIDIIYVEAGMDPANRQQCYYRDIEDQLGRFGYKLFKIYEQKNQWTDDSPVLRRVNMAFFSDAFAGRNPYRVTRQLFSATDENLKLKVGLKHAEDKANAAAQEAQEARTVLEGQSARLVSQADDLRRAREAIVEAERRHRELTSRIAEAHSKAEEEEMRARRAVQALAEAEAARGEIAAMLEQARDEHARAAGALSEREGALAAMAAERDSALHALEHYEGAAEERMAQALNGAQAEITRLSGELRQKSVALEESRQARRNYWRDLGAANARAEDMEKAVASLVASVEKVRQDGARALAAQRDQLLGRFSYRLGSSLTGARSIGQILSLPGKIMEERRAFKAERSAPPKLVPPPGPLKVGDQVVNHERRFRVLATKPGRKVRISGLAIGADASRPAKIRAAVRHLDKAGKPVGGPAAAPDRPNILPVACDQARAFQIEIQTPAEAATLEVAFVADRGDAAFLRILDVAHAAETPAAVPSPATRSPKTATPSPTAKPAPRADVAAIAQEIDALRNEPPLEAAAEIGRRLLGVTDPAERFRLLQQFDKSRGGERQAVMLSLADALEAGGETDDAIVAYLTFVRMRVHQQRQAFRSAFDLFTTLEPAMDSGRLPAAEAKKAAEIAANALVRLGRSEEALAFIDAQLRRRKTHRALEELRARILSARDPDSGLEAFRHVVHVRQSDSISSILTLAELHCQQGDLDEAETLVLKRLENSNNRDLMLALANIAARRQDWAGQRLWIDRYFESLGVWSPAQADAHSGPFIIADVAAADLPAITEGPKVSVVMTAYNAGAHIEFAVRSVLAQTYRNFELYIVDDVSADDTREIIARLAAEDDRIKPLFRAQNAGTYVAKNSAIAICDGELITCHDSDDWWHPQHLEIHVRHMLDNPRLMATKSAWVRISEDGLFMLKRWGTYSHLNPASAIFWRKAVEEIGFFDSVRTGADTEYWHRLLATYGPERVEYHKWTLALGLHHEKSLTTSGAAGFDEEGVSLVRLEYCEGWAGWQSSAVRDRAPLFLSFPLYHRPFAEPEAISTPKPAPETA